MTAAETSRPFDITFEHRPEYLYVSLTGTNMSYEVAKKYWEEIMLVFGQRRHTRVLVERSIPQRLDTQDIFRILTEVAFIARLGMKFAFVDHFYDKDRSEFEELVGTNRGLNIKYFEDRERAERWLVGS